MAIIGIYTVGYSDSYLEQDGIHIIRAQTGIGKPNLYLDYLLKNPNETFLIAVPTHKLKMEVYNNAIRKGIRNIAYTPEMPEFSPDVKRKIQHIMVSVQEHIRLPDKNPAFPGGIAFY